MLVRAIHKISVDSGARRMCGYDSAGDAILKVVEKVFQPGEVFEFEESADLDHLRAAGAVRELTEDERTIFARLGRLPADEVVPCAIAREGAA